MNLGEGGADIMTDSSSIRIEPFSRIYTTAVVDLIVGIQQKEFHLPITAADQPDLADIPEFYQNGCGNFWVALHQGEVIGTVSLLDVGHHQAALRKMFVKAAFRGKSRGTAGKLLETLLAWAGEQQIRQVFLGTTQKFLAAHRFYDKNGFEKILKADLPASFPIMKVDTIFYRYTIAP